MNDDTEARQSLRKMQDAAKVFYDFTYDPEYTLRTFDHINYYRRNMMLKGYHSMNEKVMREAVDAALEARAYYPDCNLPEVVVPADGHVAGLDDFLRMEQWFLTAAELTAAAKAPAGSVKSQALLSNGREKPWDNKRVGFILISKARTKYCDGPGVPTTPTLGRTHCRPDGEFDYMKNGHRRKVHETQFAAYAERQRWTKVPVQGIKAIVEAYEDSSQELQEKLKKQWNMDWKKLARG
ncbi:MAG: hypothetical protein ABFE13_27135 [Phycisphaerales bacterium]